MVVKSAEVREKERCIVKAQIEQRNRCRYIPWKFDLREAVCALEVSVFESGQGSMTETELAIGMHEFEARAVCLRRSQSATP